MYFNLVQKEWIWGLLTLIWVALGYLTTLTAVTIGKFRIVDFLASASEQKSKFGGFSFWLFFLAAVGQWIKYELKVANYKSVGNCGYLDF